MEFSRDRLESLMCEAGHSPQTETGFLSDSNDQETVPGDAAAHHPDNDANIPDRKSLLAFFLYTFILAIPFWQSGYRLAIRPAGSCGKDCFRSHCVC